MTFKSRARSGQQLSCFLWHKCDFTWSVKVGPELFSDSIRFSRLLLVKSNPYGTFAKVKSIIKPQEILGPTFQKFFFLLCDTLVLTAINNNKKRFVISRLFFSVSQTKITSKTAILYRQGASQTFSPLLSNLDTPRVFLPPKTPF